MIKGPTILTADGNYFDFERPDPNHVTIKSVARGLANTCRFAGQCARFYSVAEHSVLLSKMVSIRGNHIERIGLLHDAAEAFILDMPKPLKEMLPDYKAVESRVEEVVFSKFGFSNPLPAIIKDADRRMLATEQSQIMFNTDDWKWTHSVIPYPLKIECWPPDRAYHEFMLRAEELGIDQ
jgi:hypothetical protein